MDAAPLTLALLVTRVAANHEHAAVAPDNLAVFTNALDAGSHFHRPTSGTAARLAKKEETITIGKELYANKGKKCCRADRRR
jgi:hypothetical protein